MLVDVFESKEVMNAIEDSLGQFAKKEDTQKIMSQIKGSKLDSNSFINQIGDMLKRYFTTKRTIAILLEISRRLRELVDIDLHPKILEVSVGEQLPVEATITNNSGLASKFRITIEQENKDTPVIFDPRKNFVDFRREIEVLIDSPQTKVMKVVIKPEMLGIKDVGKIREDGSINFRIRVKVESTSVAGLRNSKESLVGIFK